MMSSHIPALLCRGGALWREGGLCATILLLAGGCATTAPDRRSELPFPGFRTPAQAGTNRVPAVVSYPEYRDPLSGFNRAVFAFNDVTYRYVLIPVANGYTGITPDPVERSIGNFFYNIKMPIYAVNHLLQLKPRKAGANVLRFGVNTTAGLLGFFDPARAWLEMERSETHLEDTLAGYGMGYGIYLVLPIFGPSDLRHGLSTAGDHFLNPIPYLVDVPVSTGIQSFDYVQDFAPGADRYRVIREKSEDPYIFFRNLYLQGVQRDAAYADTP